MNFSVVTERSRIGYFVLFSLLLHGAFLLAMSLIGSAPPLPKIPGRIRIIQFPSPPAPTPESLGAGRASSAGAVTPSPRAKASLPAPAVRSRPRSPATEARRKPHPVSRSRREPRRVSRPRRRQVLAPAPKAVPSPPPKAKSPPVVAEKPLPPIAKGLPLSRPAEPPQTMAKAQPETPPAAPLPAVPPAPAGETAQGSSQAPAGGRASPPASIPSAALFPFRAGSAGSSGSSPGGGVPGSGKTGKKLSGVPLLSQADLDRFSRREPNSAVDLGGKDTVSLSSTDLDKASYLASIKRKIELVWTYPEEAGRRGIGGTLVLVFTIAKSGKLDGVRLEDSSGYRILDDEAERAVRQAAPFNPLPDRMHRQQLRIRAAFRYINDRQGVFRWVQ